MPPATLNHAVEHDRTDGRRFDGSIADSAAVAAARDAVTRYLAEFGLPANSRPAVAAVNACLDAAFGEVGPDASPRELSRVALRQASTGMSRWLGELIDRVPTPPPHAALAARLHSGGVRAVPESRRKAMTPQRFGD